MNSEMNEHTGNIRCDEINHLINISYGKSPSLFHLRLILTNRCNLKCGHCVGQNRIIDASKEISDERYISCIEEAITLGLRYLLLIGGGEVLVRKKLISKILKLTSKNKQVYCSLQTNGTLFSEDLIKAFVKAKWQKISISIDGPDAETNDPLRGNGSYDRIINTIKRFNYWKKKQDSDLPELSFATVLCSKNYDKIDKIITLAHDLSMYHFHLQPIYLVKDNAIFNSLKLTESQLSQFTKKLPSLIALAKKYNMSHNFNIFSSELIRNCETTPGMVIEKNLKERKKIHKKKFVFNILDSYCLDFWNFMMVSAHGDIQFCAKEYPFGFNIKKDKLKDVWLGNRLKEIRKQFLKGKKFIDCDKCCPGKLIETVKTRNLMRESIEVMGN